MSANDQLPLFPEDDSGNKPSDNHEPPALLPIVITQSDEDDFSWTWVLKDHFQTSSKLGKAFNVPADYILRWAEAGYFTGLKVKKGTRKIQLFNRVGVAKFLMKPEAGTSRLKCVKVPLSALKAEPAIYARFKPTRQNCAALIQAIRDGIKLPPPVAMQVGIDLLVVDGIRRHFSLTTVHGATDPLVEVFILPGNMAQAKAFAATCDIDAGAGPARRASAYFKQLVAENPALLAQILANKLKSPSFGKAFGLPRSTMDRCFDDVGWVTDRKPNYSEAMLAKRAAQAAKREALEAINKVANAKGTAKREEAINQVNEAVVKLYNRCEEWDAIKEAGSKPGPSILDDNT